MTKGPVARLALEDGTVFRGFAFGACDGTQPVAGEVVFNTALTGYQEAVTDPSYTGQILTFTAPMIGNYGISPEDGESAGPQVAGVVIRELSRVRSNHRSFTDLANWLAGAGVMGIEGVDTRALVRRLRTLGSMRGVLSCSDVLGDHELVEHLRASGAAQSDFCSTNVEKLIVYTRRDDDFVAVYGNVDGTLNGGVIGGHVDDGRRGRSLDNKPQQNCKKWYPWPWKI